MIEKMVIYFEPFATKKSILNYSMRIKRNPYAKIGTSHQNYNEVRISI